MYNTIFRKIWNWFCHKSWYYFQEEKTLMNLFPVYPKYTNRQILIDFNRRFFAPGNFNPLWKDHFLVVLRRRFLLSHIRFVFLFHTINYCWRNFKPYDPMKVGINEKIRKQENHKFILREHFDPPSYLKQKTEMNFVWYFQATWNAIMTNKNFQN